MDLNALQTSLNRILILEESQVKLYSTLASQAPNEELTYGLGRLADIESDHVSNIEAKLNSLFPQENRPVNRLKTSLTAAGINMFGSTVGAAGSLTGIIPLLKAGAAAEEKAMADYRQTIAQIKDFELRDIFWEHLIDEELHYLWLKKKIEQFRQ